jgi:hypothetical protein
MTYLRKLMLRRVRGRQGGSRRRGGDVGGGLGEEIQIIKGGEDADRFSSNTGEYIEFVNA